MNLKSLFVLALTLAGVSTMAQGWPGYARDPQHTGISKVQVQPMKDILWSMNLDLNPPGTQIHYGSMLITPNNTVIATIKTGTSNGFKLEGHRGRDGLLLWTQNTDYLVPSEGWIASCGSTLTPQGKLAVPGLGGTIYIRDNPDSASSTITQLSFYGMNNYQANPAAYDSNVKICTPITSDCQGNLYFGFRVSGATPLNLASGIAKITPEGFGSYTAATTISADNTANRIPTNCAPAISNDGTMLYVGVMNGSWNGYLVGIRTSNLEPVYRAWLVDPRNGGNLILHPSGTSSPTIGPDNDVYFGGWADNRYRGFLCHWDETLTIAKPIGAFGWDDTASIVPRECVPSYFGASPYLILTKYNNYLEGGGDGSNKLAILDPNDTELDPISGTMCMKPILTILSPTHDERGGPEAVTEWCINTAAIDPFTKSAVVNCEDGVCYRWDLVSNTLADAVRLTNGVGEAYTPTAIGPDGTAYIINNRYMFAVSKKAVASQVSIARIAVAGGVSTTGTVSLNVPAPNGGANVLLSSANPSVVQVPNLVYVPTGMYSASFPVTTSAVGTTQTVTITATRAGGVATTDLTVTKIVPLVGLSATPLAVAGGTVIDGTVSMSYNTPAGGANVLLSSSNTNLATVPSYVNVAAGSSTGEFKITTYPTNTTQLVTITATRAGVTKTIQITTSKLVPLKALSLETNTVTSGGTVAGTVTITSPAPAGGANVLLYSSNNDVAMVPSLVRVNTGQTQVSFVINAGAVACARVATITATRAGITKTLDLTVVAPMANSVTFNPSIVTGGSNSTATLTLNGPVAIGGAVVFLTSSNMSVATVPDMVFVPYGSSSVNFQVHSLAQTSASNATITAYYNGMAQGVLTVTP